MQTGLHGDSLGVGGRLKLVAAVRLLTGDGCCCGDFSSFFFFSNPAALAMQTRQ